MKIQTGTPQNPGPPRPPRKELEVKPDLDNIADRYNGSRVTGNYISGMTLGAAKETIATAVQSPRLAWEIAENLWQAETIGPNLKILGTLAAIPAAALSIPAGPFYGAFKGFTTVSDAMRQRPEGRDPLRPDTSAAFAQSVFPGDGLENTGPTTMTGQLCQSLERLGEAKLAEGEKPVDVPLLSPAFAVVGGVVSGVISGCAGLVAGLVAGTITCAKEMAGAVTQDGLSVGGRIGKFVAAPLNVVAMPLALAWNGVKEALPRGLVDGWKHGPIKPVVDTAKASAGLAVGVVKEAWER